MATVGDNDSGLSLNVMPMLDIFSVLILFLLMSFSVDPVSHDLSRGVILPESSVLVSLDERPTIVLERDAIKVNDQLLFRLHHGRRFSHLKRHEVNKLFKLLKSMSDANERYAKNKDRAKEIALEIDKSHKFSLIKGVMHTAQQAGFIKFKLMVSKAI